jgi:hypothetical protein
VWQPPEAEGSVAARISEVAELRGIAVGDPLAKSTAVSLRLMSLGDHLVPVPRVGAEQATIAHDPGDTGRVKGVLDQLEGPPKVALPAIEVTSQQDVKGSRPSGGKHQ